MVELRKPTQIQNHVAPPAPVPPAEPESMAIANTLNSATGAESSSAFAGPPDTRHFDQSITAHDGNVLQKSRAFHRHIRRKFTGPNGVFTKFLITIDLVLLAMFVLVQNMMISQLFGSTLLPNFFNPTILYVLDVICILLFYYSVVNTRRYYQRKCSANSSERDNCRSFSVLNLNFTFPEKMGELPFIYISWLFYTIVFVSRIVFIQFAISQTYTNQNLGLVRGKFSGRHVTQLEAAYALTSIIFILFMEAHRNSEDDLHFEQTSTWTDNLMQHTALEIFDSVILLDLIMPDFRNAEIDSRYMEITLFLAVVNFFLPTVGLIHLSQLASSLNTSCSSLNLVGMSRNIFLHAFRLVCVNMAYMVIRVMTSSSSQVSGIFVIKNLLGILVGCRSLFKEIFEYIEKRKKLKLKRQQQEALNHDAAAAAEALRTDGFELQQIDMVIKDKKFDEVSLNNGGSAQKSDSAGGQNQV